MTDPIAPLTEMEVGSLRWMIITNRQGIGLNGPTVRRCSPLPEIEHMRQAGLCTLRLEGRRDAIGYWITDAGRNALAAHDAALAELRA